MTYPAFISASLALLLAPGPTNTLIGIAGARGGLGSASRLLPAELAGYLTTILPLTWLGAEFLSRHPAAAIGLKAFAAAWVMLLAVKLWRMNGEPGTGSAVTGRRVYLTTVLNPKALIFGLVLLLPPAAGDFLAKLGLFCLMVAAVALLWSAFGRLTQAGETGDRRLLVVQRVASIWLAVVSVTLIAGVLRS